MMLKRGIVVATHPEDHSVDLVLSDGRRLTGVQVSTPNGSSRSGTFDMPAVPEKPDKWDITKITGQDQIALVSFIDGMPVVTGFLYPQQSQMTFDDPKVRFTRHQSDVTTMIDGEGNMQLTHPSGAFVRIGSTSDMAPIASKNTDKSLAVDRNTGSKPFVRVVVPGAFDLEMSPTGQLKLTVQQGADIEFGQAVTLKAPSVTLDTPIVHCTQDLTVDGVLTYQGGMVGSGGSTTASLQGNVVVQGNLQASGSITDGNGDGGA